MRELAIGAWVGAQSGAVQKLGLRNEGGSLPVSDAPEVTGRDMPGIDLVQFGGAGSNPFPAGLPPTMEEVDVEGTGHDQIRPKDIPCDDSCAIPNPLRSCFAEFPCRN